LFRHLWIVLFLSSSFVVALDDTLSAGRTRMLSWFGVSDGANYFDFLEMDNPILLDGSSADFEKSTLLFEYQYGWRPEMTLVFRTAHETHTLKAQQTVETDGISGYYVGLRQRLNRRGTATRLLAETGMRYNEKGGDSLPLSSDGIDWYAIASYNQDFLKGGGFEMDFGYRFRGGDPADEVFFDTSFAFGLRSVFLLELSYHVVESQKENKVAYDYLDYASERGFQTGGIELKRNLGKSWELGLGYEDMFRGRNSFQTSGWRLSLAWWK